MKALNNECARDAVNFIYKHGDLTYGSAYDAIQLLTSNGFAIYRTDGDEQVVYTDPDGKVWHPHRGYWCWKVSHELAQAQKRIKELEAEPAPAARSGAVKVKPLDEDDYEEIISAAAINMRKATSGIRGQMITVQDGLDWWVMKETERRVLAALEPAEPAPAAEPILDAHLIHKIPSEIIDAALRVELFFRSQNIKDWKLLGIQSRSNTHPSPSEARLREALENVIAIGQIAVGNATINRMVSIARAALKETSDG